MNINQSYKEIRKSIVAFVHKYIPVYADDDQPPMFPPIIGTGFVVREDGIIATNAHVVKAFGKVFQPPNAPKDEWPVDVILFKLTEEGMLQIRLDIIGVLKIGDFKPGGNIYYGPKEGPDIAYVHVKARGLPAVIIDDETVIEEGMEVATAGYPMGTDALTAPGWLHQITPTLQKGIISAVLPFSCSTPHALSINIMTQGGASGSPVFSSDTGKVIGALYAGLHDIDTSLKQKDYYRVPTNISYVVPGHYIVNSMKALLKQADLKTPPDTKTLDEMIAGLELGELAKSRRDWVRQKIEPDFEKQRIQSLSRVQAPKSEE